MLPQSHSVLVSITQALAYFILVFLHFVNAGKLHPTLFLYILYLNNTTLQREMWANHSIYLLDIWELLLSSH